MFTVKIYDQYNQKLNEDGTVMHPSSGLEFNACESAIHDIEEAKSIVSNLLEQSKTQSVSFSEILINLENGYAELKITLENGRTLNRVIYIVNS